MYSRCIDNRIRFIASQVPRCGRSIGGGSERCKSRFHDPRAHACRGLMHPFVGGIASTSPRDPSFPIPVLSSPSRLVFFSFAAASYPRSHKRFYDLHPVRVRGPIFEHGSNIPRLRSRTSCENRHRLRRNSVPYFRNHHSFTKIIIDLFLL